MNAQTIRRLYAGAVVGYVIAIAAGILLRDYLRERGRVEAVVAETVADLDARADEIRAKIPAMLAGEGIEREAVEAPDAT